MTAIVPRFDTAALNRALIGFDRMFDTFEARLANQITTNYPPHNIMKTGENTYSIELAVAGFAKNEINVSLDGNELTIKSESLTSEQDADIQYLHRGLSRRDFIRVFPLAEHIKVLGAEIKDGIITVKLERIVPEELKPRLIDIIEIK